MVKSELCQSKRNNNERMKGETMKGETKRAGWTPGPWEYLYGSVYQVTGEEDGLEDESENRIAIMDRSNPKATSNGRLIAEAPELVEALRGVCNAFDAPHRFSMLAAMTAVRAALARVEGGAA